MPAEPPRKDTPPEPGDAPPLGDEESLVDEEPEDDGRTGPPAPPVASHERRVALQVGELFGVDVRPSRTFVWIGRRRAGREAIVSLGGPPSVPRRPLEERTVQVGGTEVTYAGNPAVTVPLSAYRAVRQALRARASRRRP